GVLDPMTGAFLRRRPNLSEGDLRVCDETIPVFDGKLRFNLVLEPKQQTRLEHKTPDNYSGLAAVCGVKFIPISGFRPDDRTAIAARVANRKFIAGPAAATKIKSRRGLCSARKLTGTGLA